MNRKTIPTVAGIFLLVVGLALGVLLVQQRQVFRLGASGEFAPKDVRVTNITDSSATISWTTDKSSVGFVEWGSSVDLGTTAQESSTATKNIHSVTIHELKASSSYYFEINSGGSKYNNSGVAWTFQTGTILNPPQNTILISGNVLGVDGSPAEGVLVYATVGGASGLSTTTSSNGSWIIPLSSARTNPLNAYASIDESSTVIEIFIQGGALGIATAQAFASTANPTPNITLGQSYDFRSASTSTSSGNPEVDLNLPQDQSEQGQQGSLFQLDEGSSQTSTKTVVTIDSIEQDGEVIYTEKPQFFGKGPANADITVTVESDPQTESVTVASSGRWNWTPPDNLSPGTHTLTITWRDAQGFLRSITREFVVQAADGSPAFESTPSGTTTPTSTPSPTPKPTASPTPSPSPTPTPSPSPTPTPSSTPTPKPTDRISTPSTASGIPVAGSLTPTLLLATMGLSLVGAGIFISKKANI